MLKSCFVLFSVVMALPLQAESLSEQQALLSGLEHRYELRILRLENRIDSLNVESARSRWLPQVSASAGVFYQPHDSTGITYRDISGSLHQGGFDKPGIATTDSLSIAQSLPGGGSIGGGGVLNTGHYFRGKDSTLRSSTLALSYTQPLLRNAWRFGDVAYTVKIARLDNEQFTLEQKKRLLSSCSDIRVSFWRLYEAQSLAGLYLNELTYAEERMTTARTRYAVGVSAPLDTLDAALALINATARLHDAQSNELQVREELTFYTGLAENETIIDTTAPISCPSLPPPDELLKMAEKFDPQLRIFNVAAERLELTRARSCNSLLPRVDLNASWSRSLQENATSGEERFYGNSVIGLIASYAFPNKPRRLELSKAAASMQKNELALEQYRQELQLKVRELNRSWERERRAIEIAAAARRIAQQTLTATREGFTVGTIDRLSLDKAENDYRSACVGLLKKQITMKQLAIIFDEMTGATFSRLGVEMK